LIGLVCLIAQAWLTDLAWLIALAWFLDLPRLSD
jgi:hypothetical protein